MDDWHDPFAEDEAARERERRRAEREARRLERRRTLADKVRAEEPPAHAESVRVEEPPAPAAERPASESPAGVEEDAVEGHGPAAATERHRIRARLARRAPRRRGQLPDAVLWRRRLAGLAIALALGGILAYAVISLADRIGGDDAAPAAPELGTVTIPEGLPIQEVAEVAKEAGVRGNYRKATRRAKGFDPRKYGAGKAPNLEGFLFPATYELPEDARVEDLIARQLDAFRENIRGVDMKRAKSKNLNTYDVLKIASMVEREVQVAKERRLVSAVIYNRLAAGNPLGIDATIRYEDQNYDKQLTESRLNQPTPYNTRLNAGLPPTPIGNPGLAAIKAAANPARTNDFYFVVKPGTCEHFFTSSEEEFNRASERYQRALEREGGSPTDC
jgi:UPF0755 protein